MQVHHPKSRSAERRDEYPTSAEPPGFAVAYPDGGGELYGGGAPQFTFRLPSQRYWSRLQKASLYAAALAYIRGEFDIEGDAVAAAGFKLRGRRNWQDALWDAATRLDPHRVQSWVQTRRQAARNIQFHYDLPTAFYQQFLDPNLVYSCAWFQREGDSLEQAQSAKLDLICRKLNLRPGERFLDIGCGWGALVLHAAAEYGVEGDGCTLSAEQATEARERVQRLGLASRVRILASDYRNVTGRFDKIASVGMFEHVGRKRLGTYFAQVHRMLADDGLFLNHGIIRPRGQRDSAETLFLRRHVFPGGELAHLDQVLQTAEHAGFEVLDVENLRPHYARTCRAWVRRLQENERACTALVAPAIHRTWLLYLAASACGFEAGTIEIHQVLLAKRGAPRRLPLSRTYMYAPREAEPEEEG